MSNYPPGCSQRDVDEAMAGDPPCSRCGSDPCDCTEETRSEMYAQWIADYVAQRGGFVRGVCGSATSQMVAAFPELRRAAGFAHASWGRDQHWWCVAPDGSIVDPTVEQFSPFGVIEYEELDLDDPRTREIVPTGRCMECGGDAYEGKTFCSDACEKSFGKGLS